MFNSIRNQLQVYFKKANLKPVGQVLSSQLILQALSFGIGIILVRELPKTEYAIYSILTSILAILSILSTSGIMIGFTKIGGKIWDDISKLSSLIKTASSIRIYLTAGAFLISATYGYILLTEQNIPLKQTIFFLFCILLIVIPEIFKAFISEALLLRKEIATVQLVQLLIQSSRLLALGLVFLFFKELLSIGLILTITVISTWIGYFFIKYKSSHLIDSKAPIIPEYKKTLLHYIKLIWHNELFFAFQGQISIFLIGIFSTSNSLANLGALGRFSIIFNVLASLVGNIYGPKFAINQNLKQLKKQFHQLIILLLSSSTFILTIANIFPNLFLWVLGPKYAGLKVELSLVLILGSLNLLVTGISSLNQTKGWIKYRTHFEIPLNIIVLTCGIYILDMSNLKNVLYLSILVSISNIILCIANSIYGFKTYLKS